MIDYSKKYSLYLKSKLEGDKIEKDSILTFTTFCFPGVPLISSKYLISLFSSSWSLT